MLGADKENDAIPAGCVLRLDAAQLSLSDIKAHASEASQPLLLTRLSSHLQGQSSAAALVTNPLELAQSAAGGASVSACDSPVLAQLGDDGGPRRSLRDFLEGVILNMSNHAAPFDDEPYVFDQGGFLSSDGGRALAERLRSERADAALGVGDGRLVFSLGGRATGLTWHTHPYAWLELLVGEKRWYTATPGSMSLHVDTTLPTAAWVKSTLGGDPLAAPPAGVCAFTQRPGDIVVVPGLMRATYNLAAFTVGYGRRDGRPKPQSYEHLTHMVLSNEGSPLDFETVLRHGLARFPSDPALLISESRRLSEAGSVKNAIKYAIRAHEANPLDLDVQIHYNWLVWRHGERDRALCTAWKLEAALKRGFTGRLWAEPHPRLSRSAMLDVVSQMLSEQEHMRIEVGGLRRAHSEECEMISALVIAKESNFTAKIEPWRWQGWLAAATRQQSLETVEWLMAHPDAESACNQLEDGLLLALLHHVVAWGTRMQTRSFLQAFWLDPRPRDISSAALEFTLDSGRYLFHQDGATRLQELLTQRATAASQNSRMDESAPGFTLLVSEAHALAVDFCLPYFKQLIQCGGQRPQLDASGVAIELAHWGSMELMRLLLSAGYMIGSIVSRTKDQQDRNDMNDLLSHALSVHSASHAAAFAGNTALLQLLERNVPPPAHETPRKLTPRAILPVRSGHGHDGHGGEFIQDGSSDGGGSIGTGTIRSAITPEGGSGAQDIDDGGGWDDGREVAIPGEPATSASRCDLEQLDAKTVLDDPERFFQDFILRRRPVLVRGLLRADPAVSRYARLWTRKALLRSLGRSRWRVSSIPYRESFMNSATEEITLRDFVRESIDHGEGMMNDTVPSYIFSSFFGRAGAIAWVGIPQTTSPRSFHSCRHGRGASTWLPPSCLSDHQAQVRRFTSTTPHGICWASVRKRG